MFIVQEIRYLARERSVLPGDLLSVECTYDTTERETTTLGGTSTRDEMCSMFLSYYPKMDNAGPCLSGPTKAGIMAALGLGDLYPDSDVIKAPSRYQGMTWREMAEEKDEWTENDVDQISNAYLSQKHKAYCHLRENEYNKITPREFVTYPQGKGYYDIPVKDNIKCKI